MKDNLRIAAVQIPTVWMNSKENLRYIKESIARAKEEKNVDVIVFPELSSIGYIKKRDKKFGCEYIKNAEKIPGPFVNEIAAYAKKYEVYVIAGMTELHPVIPGGLYNSAVLIDSKGNLVGTHHKIHIPGYEKHYFIPGNKAEVFKTPIGNFGITICYDGQFPELTRTLALKGAEILVMLWNMPDFSNPPELLQYITATRAAENRMFAVSCNRIGQDDDISFFGHSAISDPVGVFLAKAGREETILYAELKQDRLLEERAQQPVFRDRRPDMYLDLVKNL